MVRVYGDPPYLAAVIHGGPGDLGSLNVVARRLASITGVIEPIQSKYSIEALVEELNQQLQSVTEQPLTLIGHSWGAWLSVLYAAAYPEKVDRIILVGSGPFDACYAATIHKRRTAKLSQQESALFQRLLSALETKSEQDKRAIMTELGRLIEKTDNYRLDSKVTTNADELSVDGDMYAAVWPQAEKLRREGKLVGALTKVACPIVIIHGSDDPHPIDGVVEPLTELGIPFEKHILPCCGHSPFKEALAGREFYQLLEQQLLNAKNV